MLFSLLKSIVKGEFSLPTEKPSETVTNPDHLKNSDLALRKVLNVGGNSKDIPIPSQYSGWQHDLLDIDASGNPDIVCDARALTQLVGAQYDAVYCSHNLEHYYKHDVAKVLSGFRHILKEDGFVHIRVPDIGEVMRQVVSREMDIDDVLYESQAGPILVNDVLYGLGVEIERSGNDFFAHKTGFTQKSLTARLKASGFSSVASWCSHFEIGAIAFKNVPTAYVVELFNIQNALE